MFVLCQFWFCWKYISAHSITGDHNCDLLFDAVGRIMTTITHDCYSPGSINDMSFRSWNITCVPLKWDLAVLLMVRLLFMNSLMQIITWNSFQMSCAVKCLTQTLTFPELGSIKFLVCVCAACYFCSWSINSIFWVTSFWMETRTTLLSSQVSDSSRLLPLLQTWPVFQCLLESYMLHWFLEKAYMHDT